MDDEHSGVRTETAEADDIAASEDDRRVPQQAAIHVRAVPRAEVRERETALVVIILDDRMPVINGLSLRHIVIITIIMQTYQATLLSGDIEHSVNQLQPNSIKTWFHVKIKFFQIILFQHGTTT